MIWKPSNTSAAMSGADTTPSTSSRGGESRSTRDLILDAAERRFAERGFAGVAVREIAADAGLKNQASLYHHFKNKRAIYEAVLARGIEPLMKMISARPTGAETAPTEALVDRMLDYLRRHPHLPRLLQRAGLDESRYLRKALGRYMRPLYDEGLRRLAISGTPWAPEELPYLAAGFYHLIFGYFADAAVLAGVVEADLRSSAALARERRFLKKVTRKLLGTEHDSGQEPAAP
jgi:AcrR family transcriptional regulator